VYLHEFLILTINSHFYALATLPLLPIELEADWKTESGRTMCRIGKQSSLLGIQFIIPVLSTHGLVTKPNEMS